MREVRAALGAGPDYIETVPARGYRFLATEEPSALDDDAREAAQQALQVLIGVYGYERSSAKVALGALVDARYHD